MAFTYFFRDQQALDLIVQYALPELNRRRYINIWDAGCAMGPEPYSLAITFRENMGHFLFRNLRIHATDIADDDRFGPAIAGGLFTEVEVGRIPAGILDKYFTRDLESGGYRILAELRRAVAFQRHDLLSLQPIREELGLIVCKNVLLHFTPEQRREVVTMFHRALVLGGYFVTEQTQKLPAEAETLFRRVTPSGQLFQKMAQPT